MILRDIYINDDPLAYLPSNELIRAAEVAYALKRPLLLSGEPGTGKTNFAYWLAATLAQSDGFSPMPLVFNTKSTSVSQDLFYFYDAVSHFRDNRMEQQHVTTADYIELRALGLAIEMAKGESTSRELIADNSLDAPAHRRTVVLIDEVDKAPRDFPNDLLNELDKYEFEIKELNLAIRLNPEERRNIFIILTSNFEKNLPEAFLRRCIYFHIEFPSNAQLRQIVSNRLDISDAKGLDDITKRVNEFLRIRRNEYIQKKPSTSELLDYMRVLKSNLALAQPLLTETGTATPEGTNYLPLILKKKEDRDLYVPKDEGK
jgi:MoxR-like ATPase